MSHEGLGSVRVIATTAVMGQAAGTAAALCIRDGHSPLALQEGHMDAFRRALARADQSMIGLAAPRGGRSLRERRGGSLLEAGRRALNHQEPDRIPVTLANGIRPSTA